MYIYRPHAGALDEAMKRAREFETFEEMLSAIVDDWTLFDRCPAFDASDIVIDEETINDRRIGWEDTRRVCVKRIYNDVYPYPQCIGWMATKYK